MHPRPAFRSKVALRAATLLAAGGLGLAAVAGAQEVGSPAPTVSSTSTTSVPPSTSMSDAPSTNSITVTGTGDVHAAPDVMTVTVGVMVRRPSVVEARRVADERAEAVITAVRQAGVAESDVQTVQYSIRPDYRYPDDGSQVLEGFSVTNTVRVTVRDLPSGGAVIDAAAAAGGDEIVVSGVEFRVSDPAAASASAREAAWADARDKAAQLAALAGRSLGPVVAISETSASTPPGVPVGRVAESAAVPIEPGSVSLSVSVTVRFELG